MTHAPPDLKRTAILYTRSCAANQIFFFPAGLLLFIVALVGLLNGCNSDQHPKESTLGKKGQSLAVGGDSERALSEAAPTDSPQRGRKTGAPAVRKTAKTASPPQSGAGEGGQQERGTPTLDNLDDAAIEVLPPQQPGDLGVTQAEIDAVASTEPDPKTVEVLPPLRPGERGVTQAEIDAAASSEPDLKTVEVLPPLRPGERGVTQAEIDAVASNKIDPTAVEVLPPLRPGERGITQDEIDAVAEPPEEFDEQTWMNEMELG
jgi:hypothetical protein